MSPTVVKAFRWPSKPLSNKINSTIASSFVTRPSGQVFFRGTVKLNYIDDRGQPQQRYYHLTQRQGEMSNPLVMLNLQPGEQREVSLDLLYPPDATPPQVITIKTEELYYGGLLSPSR